MSGKLQKIRVIDSHTGGEPTRIIIEGGPVLTGDTIAEKRLDFTANFDHYRSAVVQEPRGSDVLVGGILVKSANPECVSGIIFFNNAGMLYMCGHGTIGLVSTLAYLGELGPGDHKFDTPVGVVSAHLFEDGRVAVQNVPSYRYRKDVPVDVPGIGPVKGDIAWGGNWFFLISEHGQSLVIENVEALTNYTWKIRLALEAAGISGVDGGLIDHIELFSPSPNSDADSRNFVLCPGKAYDRSPCGTGTSAKLACLASDGKLLPGEVWRQESIIGSIFEGSFQESAEGVIPTIIGTASITSDSTLILDSADPFCWGI